MYAIKQRLSDSVVYCCNYLEMPFLVCTYLSYAQWLYFCLSVLDGPCRFCLYIHVHSGWCVYLLNVEFSNNVLNLQTTPTLTSYCAWSILLGNVFSVAKDCSGFLCVTSCCSVETSYLSLLKHPTDSSAVCVCAYIVGAGMVLIHQNARGSLKCNYVHWSFAGTSA